MVCSEIESATTLSCASFLFIYYCFNLGAVAITTGFTNGAASQRIWLDNVQCGGNERSLFDCQANPLGNENCVHSEDAGVSCRTGMSTSYFVHCQVGLLEYEVAHGQYTSQVARPRITRIATAHMIPDLPVS